MKTRTMAAAAILLLSVTAALPAAASQLPGIVDVPLTTAFIPGGFDDNDSVQLATEGFFTDSCYKVGPYRANFESGKLEVHQTAYRYLGICLEMLVRFDQIVDLGIVNNGGYEVADAVSGKTLGRLPIAKANSPNQDDYIYAPVSDATIINKGQQQGQIAISGTFTDRCFYWKSIKTRVIGNVIEVLPIVDHAKLNTCVRAHIPWQRIVKFDKGPRGRYLLHVRSLEGAAINKVDDVY